jgi:hypothetical protein
MVFAISTAVLPIIQMAMGKTETLPVSSTDLPIVRLANIEQNPELIPEQPSYNGNNIDYNSRWKFISKF